MLKSSPVLTRTEKYLAYFIFINGLIALFILLFLLFMGSAPIQFLIIQSTIAVGSIIAGYHALKAKTWAFWLIFAIFFIQLAEFLSSNFSVSFRGFIAIRVGFQWVEPAQNQSTFFNINLLACFICFLALRAVFRLKKAS